MCENTERKIPETISVFAYESALMHKDADNDRLAQDCARMHRLVRWLVALVLLLIVIFVTTYTIRTRFWLDTFERFITPPASEVQNGVYQQSNQNPD